MVLSMGFIAGAMGLSFAMLIGVAIFGSVPEQTSHVEVTEIDDCVNCNNNDNAIWTVLGLVPLLMFPIMFGFGWMNGSSISKIFGGVGGESTIQELQEPRKEDGWQGASDFE